jgi:hypothetical protein
VTNPPWSQIRPFLIHSIWSSRSPPLDSPDSPL